MARRISRRIGNGSAPFGLRSGHAGVPRGPTAVFAGAVVAGFAAWGIFQATLPADLVMPLVATAFFVLAAVLGPLAWLRREMSPLNVTYTDVVGALTLIGVFAAAAIEPEQMLRLIEGGMNPKLER
ncbi:MAG: hypothetical protein ACT4OC_25030 [Bradyrhizobium sp.]